MWNPKPLLVLSICISALSPCTVASGGGKSLASAVTKDAATSLYTAPLKDGHPLVLDLSGAAISLTMCSSTTGTVTTLTANATNGANPLFPVSFPAAATCAPGQPNLPAGTVGAAGLAPSSSQSLLAQVARTQCVAKKLSICLPSDGKTTSGNSVGVAIYGGGPFIFPDRGDFTTMLAGTAPLAVGHNGSPGYFVSAAVITVEGNQVGKPGPLVVELSSTTPYTALRPDVYAPFVRAFDRAASGPDFPWMKRVPSVAPFELCYDARLPATLVGFVVPQIDLVLEGGSGSNFSMYGGNSMVLVNPNTACLGFVKAAGYQAPAAVLGGFQMENRLLVLDAEKRTLGFTLFLNGVGLSCSNFNFTLAAY